MKIVTVEMNDETEEIFFTYDKEFSEKDLYFQSACMDELYAEIGLICEAIEEQLPEGGFKMRFVNL